MPRKKTKDLALALDIAYMSSCEGSIQTLFKYSENEIFSTFLFVLPFIENEFQVGRYTVDFKGEKVAVQFFKVDSALDDPIYNLGKKSKFGIRGEGIPTLPFEAYTDNRGKYPCFFAEVEFPYRLASFADPAHPSGLNQDDPEEVEVMGLPKDKDKALAIAVVNRLTKSDDYPLTVSSVEYEEVTAFITLFKTPDGIAVRRLTTLASMNAYENAVFDHFFPNDGIRPLLDSLKSEERVIKSEQELNSTILKIINEVIKHYVEHRSWIEPFWDGKRTYQEGNCSHVIPAAPKHEIKIQPTFHVLLEVLLSQYGIHVTRESNEGTGNLDFRCMYTTMNNKSICIGIELKLAHHKKIQQGISRQLPRYLRAIQSQSGIFLVIWFADKERQFFKKPSARDKEEMVEFLASEAKQTSRKLGILITPILIDASIKLSASQA